MAMFVTGPGPFPVGNNPVSNATADLNGDGHLDLLLTNYISDNVSVMLGDGHGSFVAAAPVAVTNGPREVEVGDLDGDGDIDFLATNYSGNNVTVGLNNGNGTFVTSSVAVGTVPRGLAVGDFDGDHDLDFVSANYQANTVSVMLNNGSGSFSNATGSPIAVGTRPVAVVTGDFDGDGDIDIASTSNTTNTVSILLNNGNGTFAAFTTAATGAGPRGIAGGDFDGDGDFDLVVDNFGAASLSIMINNGSGSFTASPTTLTTSNNPYAVTVGDLDGDGDLDIATTNSGSSSVSVFLNDGSGGFTAANGSPFAVQVSPGGVVMGDFNEDGALDLSTANFGSNTLSVLLNIANQAPRGTDKTVTTLEDTAVVFHAADFGFSDVNGDALLAVKIATLPAAGSLTDNGVAVTAGQFVSIADIAAGKLRFTPAHDANGTGYAHFTFQVQDDGGTANSGADVDGTPNTITINVTPVADGTNIVGTPAVDHLHGTGNADRIFGLGSNDILWGHSGDDRLIGGGGADILIGGAGRDVFAFNSINDSAPHQSGLLNNGTLGAAAGQGLRDVITDFTHGLDTIDLSAIDANTRVAGNQAFTWRGTGNFTGAPGQLIDRVYNQPGTAHDKTVIYGDINGDHVADFQIELRGLKALVAGDFVL